MEFKVGDRVRQKTVNFLDDEWLGREGTVEHVGHYISVRFDGFIGAFDGLCLRDPEELELVE